MRRLWRERGGGEIDPAALQEKLFKERLVREGKTELFKEYYPDEAEQEQGRTGKSLIERSTYSGSS